MVETARAGDLTRLLVAARDGDRDALRRAVGASQADVWRFVAGFVGPGEADDLTQETFLRALRALPAYRGDASGRTWLLAIAHRASVDALRARSRRRRLLERVRAQPAGTTVAAREDRVSLDDLVRGLADDQRAAFVLTQVVGCSYLEAGEACGVPVGTIRSRVARARADLVARLQRAATG